MKERESESKKGRGGRIVFRLLMILLISVFLGAAVYSVNARRVLHNAMPMPFGVGLSVVLSGSMEPTLSVNDLVVVRAADSYQTDDIIVYQSGSDLIIHRIVRIDGDAYITQGDANNTADEPIGLSAIKGKSVLVIPGVGLAVRLLQTTLGKLVVIVLAAVLLSRSRRKERAEGDAELDRIKDEIRRLKALEEASAPQAEGSRAEPQAPAPAQTNDNQE